MNNHRFIFHPLAAIVVGGLALWCASNRCKPTATDETAKQAPADSNDNSSTKPVYQLSVTGEPIPLNPTLEKQQRLNQLVEQRKQAEEYNLKSGDEQAIHQLMLARAQPHDYERHLSKMMHQNVTIKRALMMMTGMSALGLVVTQVSAADLQDQLNALSSELTQLGSSIGNIDFDKLELEAQDWIQTPLAPEAIMPSDIIVGEEGVIAIADETITTTADAALSATPDLTDIILNGIFG